MHEDFFLYTTVNFGIPKVIVVIAILIAANLLWSYIKRLKRRAEQKEGQVHRQQKQRKKPSDDRIGEYVDYEEVDD